MHIGQASDYVLSFRAQGIPFFMSDLCVRGFNGVDVLDTWRRGVWSQYFPLDSCTRYGQEGLRLYGDTAAFDRHLQHLKTVRASCEQSAQAILSNPLFSPTDFARLCEAWIQFSRGYFCMGIEYTELAAQEINNLVVSTNLNRLQVLKNPTREYLNQSFVSDTSYLTTILNILAERFSVTVDKLWEYKIEEILDLFTGNTVSTETVKARAHAAIARADHGTFRFAWGEEAAGLIDEFEEGPTENTEELVGRAANKGGIIRGRVAIINVDYQDFAGMNAKMADMPQGSILIAQTTAPELMTACQKAAAIVTDLGGLMSHAAIVSRELGIPCLVGTRRATQVFRDGDLAEVDTENGVIRKLR